MGAALILPVVVLLILAVIWIVTAAKRTRDATHDDATLPVEPYARREEELRRLVREHEDANPARRP